MTDFDVVVVGGGPVGIALAARLARIWGDRAQRILLVDAKPIEAVDADPRMLALADTARSKLAWLGFPGTAVPLRHIHVSEQGKFGRVWMSARDVQRDSLGWTIRYGELVRCLHDKALMTGLTCWRGVSVDAVAEQADRAELSLSDGRVISAALRIDAEGGLFGQSADRDAVRDYGQWALVATAHAQTYVAQRPQQASERFEVAYERFTVDGPLAFLPTAADGSRYAMVWCGSPAQTRARLQSDPQSLLPTLNALMGERLPLTDLSALASFPLGLNVRSQLVNGRRVCVGNAAQILHPVAGQGLNLGFRDAEELAALLTPDVVSDANRLETALRAYEKARQPDRRLLVTLTDTMARGFSSRNPVLGAGRQLAMLGLEFLPGARRFFAETLLFGWVK